MSFVASNDVRERIRQATDIVELVGAQIELRRQGRQFVGHCRWHDDTRPSLQVNPERQTWHCYVCNIGGDVFSFVQQLEGVGFREAMQLLADRAGIVITPQRQAAVQPGGPDDKRTLYEAMAWAEKLFFECLLNSPEAEVARKYLNERGVTRESIERFRLGYSPDNWQWLVDRGRTTTFTPAVLEACDLIGKSVSSGRWYDRFRGRVMFPIRDLQRRPIAFGGRVLPGAPADVGKYINSRETKLFVKSENLYALELAREEISRRKKAEQELIIVEGYTDVVIAHQCGVRNVVAVLGTALNDRHIRLLKRFADAIYLVLDGDEAGQSRTLDILKLFIAQQMDLRILTLPDELDPADFLLARGADKFRELLGGAVDALEHQIRAATKGVDLARNIHGANRALEEILSTMAEAPRGTSNAPTAATLRQQQILARLAREFRVPEQDLRMRLKAMRRDTKPSRGAEPSAALPSLTLKSIPPREVELFEVLFVAPELAEQSVQCIEISALSHAASRAIYEIVVAEVMTGGNFTFDRLMTAIEDPRLKSLVVQVDEVGQAKADQAMQSPQQRLDRLIRDFNEVNEESRRQETLAEMERQQQDYDKEIELLKDLYESEQKRRGLSAPTDG